MNRMSGSKMEMPAMPVLPEKLEQAQDAVQSDKGVALGTRRNRGMGWFFVFFFISGFCSILYEVIWLRLAMAQFGVTSALVSIVLSMFMAGLGLGSWASGRLIRKYGDTLNIPVLRLYALTELVIACSALIVPSRTAVGTGPAGPHRPLLFRRLTTCFRGSGWRSRWSRGAPLWARRSRWACWRLRMISGANQPRSFSFLYLSNVLGAVAGATVPLLFIELLGFRGTLKIGAALNVLIALSAMALTLRRQAADAPVKFAEDSPVTAVPSWLSRSRKPLLLLFATGFTSMGMEVVWIRQYTPYLGTMVYAFAAILACYLAATFLGSRIYRLWSRKYEREAILVWALLGVSAFLPVLATNPDFNFSKLLRLAVGIIPFSFLLGFRNAHAGGPLVRGRPRPRGTRLCRQHRRLHPGSATVGIHAAAADERALGAVRAGATVAGHWLVAGMVVYRRSYDCGAHVAAREFLRNCAARAHHGFHQ